MKWFDKSSIAAAIDEQQAIAAIEQAFRDHSDGRVQSIIPGHLRFDRPPGDFHVKGAHIAGRSVFAVKMASSFFQNPASGWPSSNGLMLVFDAQTGVPLGTLLDEGMLTDLRTAIGGTIAARLIAPQRPECLGVLGAGTQAAMQARWIARTLGVRTILIWAREFQRADQLAIELQAEGLDARAKGSREQVCADADILVTTTPATEPLVGSAQLRPGLRIVAIGADAAGKREIALDVVEQADVLLVDSRSHCLAYGDSAGVSDTTRLVEIGEALAGGACLNLRAEQIAVADLTGIGVQDAAIAELAWRKLVELG